jgi:hypothetical protein
VCLGIRGVLRLLGDGGIGRVGRVVVLRRRRRVVLVRVGDAQSAKRLRQTEVAIHRGGHGAAQALRLRLATAVNERRV